MSSSAVTGQPVELERARAWARRSLEDGSALARQVLEQIDHFTASWVFAGRSFEVVPALDDESKGTSLSVARESLRRWLAERSRSPHAFLVVEHDLARVGDPRTDGCAFVDDRVLRWGELDPSGTSALQLLRSGATGYPLNAFLCRGSADAFALAPGCSLDPGVRQRLADNTLAVIHAVWDAEAYLVLERDIGLDRAFE